VTSPVCVKNKAFGATNSLTSLLHVMMLSFSEQSPTEMLSVYSLVPSRDYFKDK